MHVTGCRRLRVQSGHRFKLTGLLLLSFFYFLPSANAAMQKLPFLTADENTALQEQRVLYRRATRALSKRDHLAFAAIQKKLADYPLYPYLEYASLSSQLNQRNRSSIDKFLDDNNGTLLAAKLRHRWLEYLARTKHWKEFIHDYRASISSTELSCHYAYALYREGKQKQSVGLGIPLWQVGKSQPRACDPLFSLLIKNGHITNSIAWIRYKRALLNHEYQLARYVNRFFTESRYKQKAKIYLEIDQNPRELGNYRLFEENSSEEIEIISHGLTHLARIDAPLALKFWNRFHQSHTFDKKNEAEIISALVKSLFLSHHRATADQYLTQEITKATDELLEWRLRELIKEADWSAVIHWSSIIPEEKRNQSRWIYWRARAIELTHNKSQADNQKLYLSLSRERSFYGFLASEWLKSPYQMQHQPVPVSDEQLKTLAATEPFLRIRELYHHGDLLWARREWNRALDNKPQQERLIAAKLAECWQWHSQAILSMIQAKYWNDIDVRFPQPHSDAFLSQARATKIPVNLLLALSRQESAFNGSVTSPAGAKGLMQLMPATAKETARKHNIRYKNSSELFDPDKNILIGSRYYRDMLALFKNNRILATAAYNAGPHRVKNWRKRSAGKLPFDAWIEIIPFRETRNYVQNVLAFSIIYAHQLGLEVPMLNGEEKNTLL